VGARDEKGRGRNREEEKEEEAKEMVARRTEQRKEK
jgi:hypothetical protein